MSFLLTYFIFCQFHFALLLHSFYQFWPFPLPVFVYVFVARLNSLKLSSFIRCYWKSTVQYSSMSSLIKQFSGRKRESLVWSYFEDRPDIRKSRCIVLDEKGKLCGHLIAGKNATNLKAHLHAHHSELYSQLLANENDKKTSLKRKHDDPGMYTNKYYIIIFPNY